MRKLFLFLLLSAAAQAHPIGDRAAAVQQTSHLLLERLQSGTASWGQQVAGEDLARLEKAAGALHQAVETQDFEASKPQISEFQVAGNRVRMSLGISHLDEEGMALGQGLVTQVKEIEQLADEERRHRDDQQLANSRPVIQFGIGYSGYWGRPWGFYPYGIGYRGFGGFSRGRCR